MILHYARRETHGARVLISGAGHVQGANVAGFVKVADAMLAQGVC